MGQLVFQATLGGQVNLVGPNTASTFNLNVPATSSTIATLTGTETFTNKTLTSPTLTTPVLGTPSSGTLTSCTGLPVGGITATGTPSSTTFLRGDSSWATITATTPGGSTTQLQYNNAGAFGGISGVTTDGTRMTASTTIGVGGATPSTSGAGISFPATQSASSNANTLDDYEVGTWTPSVGTQTVVGTFASSGFYVKIGRQVTVYATATGTTTIAGAAGTYLGNLPFTPAGNFAGGVGTNDGGNYVRFFGLAPSSNGNIYIISGYAAVSGIYFSATYYV